MTQTNTQSNDGGIYENSIPQNATSAHAEGPASVPPAKVDIQSESQQRLAARGLSAATAQHFQLEPRMLKTGPAWAYTVHPKAKEKRCKAFDSDSKPKYKWLRKKPDDVTFYDPDGKLDQYIREENGVAWVASGDADVWALQEGGIHNATCLLQGEGNDVPEWFVPELQRLQVSEVRIAPDRDDTGLTFASNITKRLNGTGIRLVQLQLPFAMDSKGDIGQLLLQTSAETLKDTLESLPELPPPPAPVSIAPVAKPSSSEETKADYERWCIEVVEAAARRVWSISEPNGKDYSNLMKCPCHEEDNPSASWNYQTHSVNCFACGSHDTKEVAEKLGVQSWNDYKAEQRKNRSKKKARKNVSRSSSADANPDTASSEEIDDADLTRELAEAILEDHHFAQDPWKQLYHYEEGVYRADGEEMVRKLVKSWLSRWNKTKLWSTYRHSQVIEYIRVDAPLLWERPPLDIVNLKNGLLNVITKELSPHSPDYLSTIQLPVSYDPAATPRYWDGFCQAVLPQDAYEAGVLWQVVAWLITSDTSFQKALLLLGDGGNGKSRLLAGLKAILGRRNVTALSLQKLESDRFAPVRLKGKLANICPDLPSKHLEQNAVFKQLTGDDGDMTGEHKFSDSFEFGPFARLVFSANQPPLSSDSSDGFFRRWWILPFPRTFTGSVQVDSSEIDAKLSDPAELSGVLNKALEFLPQIREFGLTETQSMKLAHADFRQATDPLAVWLDRATIMSPDLMTSQDTLRKAYNEEAMRRERAPLSSQAFGRAFKQLRPNVQTKQRMHEGNPKTWVYLGIALRPANI